MGKNIVFTYITPFHPERGGIGRVTHSLTLEFLKKGHRVFYLIYTTNITIKHEYNYPVVLYYFPSKELCSQENISFYHEFLKEHQIDIIINQSGNFSDSQLYLNKGESKAKTISVLHSSPLVAYPHLWSETYPLKNKTAIEQLKRICRILLFARTKYRFLQSRKKQFQILLPQTDVVCLLSERFYSELSSLCPGYEHKYIAIPNPNSFTEQELIESKTVKKKELLYVGMIARNKRIDRIIHIWNNIHKDYPDWELKIIGDGNEDYVNYIKSLANQSERVSFSGFQSPLPFYQNSSILCMTSNYEGWPMMLTESMQCGTVPIAFDSFASIKDIIHDGRNGVLVDPFNMTEYKKKLCELMDNHDGRTMMSINAQNDIKKYSIENVASLWENIL